MLNGTLLSNILKAKMASKGILGKDMPSFCDAFGTAVVTSFLSMNIVNTTDTGIIAVGTGIGKLSGLVDTVLSLQIFEKFMTKGIRGIPVKSFSDALAEATVLHFNTASIINTTSAGIAVGTGIGKISGLVPTAMSTLMLTKMLSGGIMGIAIKDFCDAFSEAFCQHVTSLGIATVVISGAPVLVGGSPVPGAGVGLGKVS